MLEFLSVTGRHQLRRGGGVGMGVACFQGEAGGTVASERRRGKQSGQAWLYF